MIPIFKLVAQTLNGIASVTGFTYNEINIIAYYILLPFVYVALIDRILRAAEVCANFGISRAALYRHV